LKKITVLSLLTLSFFYVNDLKAQETRLQNLKREYKRCGTNEWLATMARTYPGFNLQYENSEKRLGDAISKFVAQQKADPNRIHAPMVIPIVFHVVLSDQSLVPDAMIMAQFNELNLSYSGLNPDSTNINYAPEFVAARGHSEIQFVLAQRTPDNLPANGIERRTINTLSTGSDFATDQIKSTSAGGLDAWDPTRFFNVWVCNFTDPDLLGYSSFPIGSPENTVGQLSQQGVAILVGSLPGGASAPFNFGGTLVHESGHFFWLRHIWGDGTCGDDFPSTPTLDDTPAQSGSTSGCPSGAQASGCATSPNPPGRMYQNYMDYTDDACYSLFTKGQVNRTYQAVNTFMPSLLTSNGGIPPVLLLNNAAISAIVTPATNFVTCDPTIPLTVTLKNYGSNPLTSVTITVTSGATTVQTFNWAGNLASTASINITLNPVALLIGANTIQICTSNPNGSPDSDPTNDCRSVNGNMGTGSALPLIEGFENTTFPPAGWIVNNPDGNTTWQRFTTTFAHSGTGTAYMDHFGYTSTGQTDDLRTPPYTIGTADSLWLSYWAAYRGYTGASGTQFDNFQIMVSTNCGQTFQVVYNARNDTAFVAPQGAVTTQSTAYSPSSADQWKRKAIDLSSFISAGNILVQFRAINGFGNNLFIDDINIDKKIFANNDAGVIAINKPDTRVCTNSMAPVAVIKNFGKINLTSVKVNYQIDGGAVITFNWTGNLARNQTATITFPVVNLGSNGNHSINVYTTLPNNVADEDATNDGLVKAYTISTIQTLPATATEEFTSTTFPPANWYVNNPDGDLTWQRNATVGNKNIGSAYFNDFANTTTDRFDDLGTPNYSYSGVDSVFLTFNVAHAIKVPVGTSGAKRDTLSVLISKDCGNTFTTLYKKWGAELQTAGVATSQNFVPTSNQWRRDSVNLGSFLSGTEPLFQVVFRISGNMENNLYLDDVNIRTQILPAKLKNEGFLILPNPFRTVFGIWHYQVPTTLRYVNVYNPVGQLVYSRRFPGGGEKFFQVDLSNKAPGVYIVNLGYEDSNKNVNIQVVKY
jgi:hypothetical protein